MICPSVKLTESQAAIGTDPAENVNCSKGPNADKHPFFCALKSSIGFHCLHCLVESSISTEVKYFLSHIECAFPFPRPISFQTEWLSCCRIQNLHPNIGSELQTKWPWATICTYIYAHGNEFNLLRTQICIFIKQFIDYSYSYNNSLSSTARFAALLRSSCMITTPDTGKSSSPFSLLLGINIIGRYSVC